MKRIVDVHHPDLDRALLEQTLKIFYDIRGNTRLRKRPSTSELIDWIAVLKRAGVAEVKLDSSLPFLGALLKKEQDLAALADQPRRRPQVPLVITLGEAMFVDFLFELRARKVPVGTQEAVALARALSAELHESSLDGFYHVARALLIHSEAHLDDFDMVFAHHFRGVAMDAKKIAQDLLDWLSDPIQMRDLSRRSARASRSLDLEEVLKQF